MSNTKSSLFPLQFFPWIILILGLASTHFLQTHFRQSHQQILREEFDFRVNKIVASIESRLHNYEQVLSGAAGLFAASPSVGREAFRTYVSTLKLESKYPGIQGVGFSQFVPLSDKSRHIEKIRAEGFPEYGIRPAGERDVYSSIIYLEPFDWRNQRAFGYDMYSEPVRRTAMGRARDENRTAISGKVQLVQETEKDTQPGFLMYLPVYRPGSSHGTLEERRANLLGWVYAPFRMNDLMKGVLGPQFGEIGAALGFEIHDGGSAAPENLMFDSSVESSGMASAFRAGKPISLFGHQWTVAVHSLPAFDIRQKSDKANLIAQAGVLVSLLLALVVWLLITTRSRALNMAESMTQALQESEAGQRALNRALRMLSDCNMALVHAEEECALLEKICRLIVEDGGYVMAWVGYAEQDDAKTVRPVAQYGYEDGYLATVQITWADSERGRGPTGTAIRTGVAQPNQDFSTNPLLAPWRADALKRGYQSSTALPLKDETGVFGALTIYSKDSKAFNEPEMQLLQELVDDLAFGIVSLRMTVARRQAEMALRRSEENLRHLNQSLEQRVQEETAKNREKDLLLIQQSRMAMMGEMMRSVAHHWRQPLNSLNLVLANIKDAYEYGELNRETLEKLVSDGNRVSQKMSSTIDGFRDFFKISEEITRFNLAESIREALNLMEAGFKNEKIEVALEITEDIFVNGSFKELSQALLNVLINAKDAIKAKGEGGAIIIWLVRENGRGDIHVRDEGGGIPEEILSKIFEPYFTTKPGGTGIGLYMSRMILERMNGHIDAHNAAEGAEVIISIPACD